MAHLFLLFSLSGFAMDLHELRDKYPNRHFEDVTLPSGITHFQSTGSGPTLILVHGVSGPLAVWDKFVEPLKNAGFRVIRYDLYGRGFSSRLPESSYDL